MLLLLARATHPLDWIVARATALPGTAVLVVYAFVLQAVILLKGFPLAYAIDTFLVPCFVLLILAALTARQHRTLAVVLVAVTALNTALAMGEYIAGARLITIEDASDVAGKLAESLDWRPTALFGHPLRNAILTGLGILIILVSDFPFRARAALLAIQLSALLIFGGRSSLVIIIALLVIMAAVQLWRVMLGYRFSILALPKFIGLAAAGIAAGLTLYLTGIFDKVIERFEWDDSAETRVSALRMFEQFEPADILFGISQSRKDTLQVLYDTQFGVEIFWLAFLMDYGLILLLGLIAAMAMFLRDLVRVSSMRAVWLIVFFLFAVTASLGLAAKGVLLSQFTALVVLFCKPDTRHVSEVA